MLAEPEANNVTPVSLLVISFEQNPKGKRIAATKEPKIIAATK
jgi:hypothetical protein